MTTLKPLIAAAMTAAALLLPSRADTAFASVYDLVILNARVMDPETGFDAVGMNIGVSGKEVAAVTGAPITGRTVIDAAGRVAAPGFIDILSYDPNGYGVRYKIADGVTTNLAMHGGALDPASWYDRYGKKGLALNYGAGFFYNAARLRRGVGNFDPVPEGEIESMASEAARAIEDGAMGIGMSLEYAPGTSGAEVEAMARVAARYGVPVFFHARYSDADPPGTNEEALNEIIGAARKTGASAHVDHITSTGGTFTMGASLAALDNAVAAGADITACAYPYHYWGTYLNSARFSKGWQKRFRIDYRDLQIGGSDERLTPDSFKRYRKEGKLAVAYAIPADEVDLALRSPLVMIGSDGINEPGDNNHPRAAGTFARTIAVYVRDKKTLTLMEALAKMSLLPAKRLEAAAPALRKKGRLRKGFDADIVLFDPEKVRDTATVERPNSFSEGFDYVIVNGTVVKDPAGLKKKARPGMAIKYGRDNDARRVAAEERDTAAR